MKKQPMLNRSSSWPVANKPAIWDHTYRHMSNGKRVKYRSYDNDEHYYYVVFPRLDKKSGTIQLIGTGGKKSFAEAINFMNAMIKQVITDVEAWHPERAMQVGSPEHDKFIQEETLKMALEDERIRLEEESND